MFFQDRQKIMFFQSRQKIILLQDHQSLSLLHDHQSPNLLQDHQNLSLQKINPAQFYRQKPNLPQKNLASRAHLQQKAKASHTFHHRTTTHPAKTLPTHPHERIHLRQNHSQILLQMQKKRFKELHYATLQFDRPSDQYANPARWDKISVVDGKLVASGRRNKFPVTSTFTLQKGANFPRHVIINNKIYEYKPVSTNGESRNFQEYELLELAPAAKKDIPNPLTPGSTFPSLVLEDNALKIQGIIEKDLVIQDFGFV
ncbi:hypothetical protein CDD82_1728 [Ophiocordyceps australis]|uniref:Uncharacterized protein n=1 Tax=Ophiocordyceps australis TaxID=1399860 RepID=A0A2C5XJE5_9HYPO|nr:hypothetical protein CDD82_1728 [Ophiocordyceps australis]